MAKLNTNLIQVTGLTGDGQWRLKDLSGSPWNLPASASGVMLVIRNTDAATQLYGFRKPGSTDSRVGSIVAKAQYTAFVGLNSNREISYRLSSANIAVYVAGYFEYDAVFYDDGIQQTIALDNQWNIVDISSAVPSNAKFAIFECLDINGAGSHFGMQPGGSSCYDIRNGIFYHTWAVVSLDLSRRYNVYGNSNDHRVFLLGYVTGGSQKQNLLPDITPTTYDAFEDVDLTSEAPPSNPTGAIVLMDWYNRQEDQTDKRYAIRKKGSTDDWTTSSELRGLVYYPVGIDNNDIFQVKVDDPDIYQEMFLMGFLADPLLAAPLEAETSIAADVYTIKLQDPLVAETSIDFSSVPVGHLSIEMPMPIIQATGVATRSRLQITMANPTISLGGVVGEIARLILLMPAPTLALATGSQLSLAFPTPTIALSGEVGALSILLIRELSFDVAISGRQNELGALRIDIAMPSIHMASDQHGMAWVSLGSLFPTIAMRGYAGIAGDVALRIRAPLFKATGYVSPLATLGLAIPYPLIHIAGDQFRAARIFKGIAVNMHNFSVTEYLDFAFNSFAFFNGAFLGASKDGIFRLEGQNDDGRPISARAKMPEVDRFKPKKRARDAWLSCRSDGEIMLVIQSDDGYWSDIFERSPVDEKERRCKIARGIRGRFIAPEIRNVVGSDFSIAELSFSADEIKGRTR